MVSRTIENVTCTVSEYAYGKSIAVICLTLILVLPMYPLQLCGRFVVLSIHVLRLFLLDFPCQERSLSMIRLINS